MAWTFGWKPWRQKRTHKRFHRQRNADLSVLALSFPQLGCLACVQSHLASAVSTSMGKVPQQPELPLPYLPFFPKAASSQHSHSIKTLISCRDIGRNLFYYRFLCRLLQTDLASHRQTNMKENPHTHPALLVYGMKRCAGQQSNVAPPPCGDQWII